MSGDFQTFPGVNLWHNAHAGHLVVLCFQRKNRIAVVGILINDAFHFACNADFVHVLPSFAA